MRRFALALALSLAALVVASAQTPDGDGGRYRFNPVADGVLRLDTRTGQVSHCNRSDAGWACRLVPDERSALEREIARLEGEIARLKQDLAARAPAAPDAPAAKPPAPKLDLPSDAEVDRMISFIEKVWRRLIEIVTRVQKDVEKRN